MNPEPKPAPPLPKVGYLVNNLAEEIDAEDVDGKRFKLSDYRGKVVFLDFWGDWCPFCKRIYPNKQELVKRLVDKPVVMIGIEHEQHHAKTLAKRAMQRDKINWPNWWGRPDTGPALHTPWGIKGFPHTVILDQNGIIRWRGTPGPQNWGQLDQLVDTLLANVLVEQKEYRQALAAYEKMLAGSPNKKALLRYNGACAP